MKPIWIIAVNTWIVVPCLARVIQPQSIINQTTQPLRPLAATLDNDQALPTRPLCDHPGQYLPHEKFCQKFYHCRDSRYESTCAPGTIWDQDLSMCNHPANVAKPRPSNCPDDDGSPIGRPTSQSPAAPSPMMTTKGKEWSFEIASNGSPGPECGEFVQFMPHESFCTRFYHCDGLKLEKTCAPGTIWDHAILTCNHPSMVLNPMPPKCPDRDGYLSGSSTTMNDKSISGSPTHDAITPSLETTRGDQTARTTAVSSHSITTDPTAATATASSDISIQEVTEKRTATSPDDTPRESTDAATPATIETTNAEPTHRRTKATFDTSTGEHTDDTAATSSGVSSEKPTDRTSNPSLKTTNAEPSDESTTVSEGTTTVGHENFTNEPMGGTTTESPYTTTEVTKSAPSSENTTAASSNVSTGEPTYGTTAFASLDTSTRERTDRLTTSSPDLITEGLTDGTTAAITTAPSTETRTTVITETSSESSSGPRCEKVGQFLPHEKYCTKFYHCGHSRFEKSCALGTIWDQTILTCNYPSAVLDPTPAHCPDRDGFPNQYTVSATATASGEDSVSNGGRTTEEPKLTDGSDRDDTEDTSAENTGSQKPQCKYLGQYMPHEKLCRKFYHCSHIRFEKNCADGTIWHQALLTCNYPTAVDDPSPKNCPDRDGTSMDDENGVSSLPSPRPPAPRSTTSGEPLTDKPTNRSEKPTERPSTPTKKPSQVNSSITTQKPRIPQPPGCQYQGQYLAHERFCSRFYHCGWKRFEKTCPQGTIWDQSLTVCNHRWAVASPTPSGCRDL